MRTPTATITRTTSLEGLRSLADASVDAVVTDPPYGLSKQPDIAEVLAAWLSDTEYIHASPGLMGKDWDSFVPGPEIWREAFRVLKPGGHILCFAGSRTFDLMGISLRLGGFEMRDSIVWAFGSGFPKSLNVARAIDKAAGSEAKENAARLKSWRTEAGLSRAKLAALVGCTPASIRDWEEGRRRTRGSDLEWLVPSVEYRAKLDHLCQYGTDERTVSGPGTESTRVGDGTVLGLGHTGVIYGPAKTELAQDWDGWGTALKPSQEPILVGRKPLSGNVANNVLAHGTGALNIDRCRIAAGDGRPARVLDAKPTENNTYAGRMDGSLQGGSKAVGTTTEGRWPANMVFTHHPDCVETGTAPDHFGGGAKMSDTGKAAVRFGGGYQTDDGFVGQSVQVPVFECHPDCPVAALDEQAGVAGGANRFFYCSKTSRRERSEGLIGGDTNPHPSVKPTALMAWLIGLVTPPGGTVVDPYLGSGSTAVAAVREGFDVIGFDRDDDGTYLPVAAARTVHAGGEVTAHGFEATEPRTAA